MDTADIIQNLIDLIGLKMAYEVPFIRERLKGFGFRPELLDLVLS